MRIPATIHSTGVQFAAGRERTVPLLDKFKGSPDNAMPAVFEKQRSCLWAPRAQAAPPRPADALINHLE